MAMHKNRLLFRKYGRAVYISHLDLMACFQRAFLRSEVKVWQTEGFNRHVYVAIALPLSVGYTSDCEILEFNLEDDIPLAKVPERLNAALDLKTRREDFKLLDAYIIGWDSGDWSEQCIINKGSPSGIQVNQCVITANGEVVGLVTEVGLNYAVVKTVLDSSLEISANIAASGYNGMVQGGYATGEEGYLRMNYLPSDSVICNHDQVVTAGSNLYPRDLVLGSVIDAGFDETGVAKFAVLEPAVDFGSLEQVFVLTAYATE